MDSKKPSDYSQDLVDIVHLYQRGGISRRGFVDRAAKFAVGGLTVAAILDGVPPSDASAQAVRKRPQRVAVVGCDHWHAANYARILQKVEKTDLLGCSAPDGGIASKFAAQFGTTAYTDYRTMIEKTKPEFVAALGHVAAMPGEFQFLVDAGIPFVMEKPWGTDAKTVTELADYAESKKAWMASSTPFRYHWFTETVVAMRRKGELGTISHGISRFNQPGVQRYLDNGSSWNLVKKESGGGAMLNLGIHGMDFFRYVTGEEPQVISAVTSHLLHKREVEDYCLIVLRTPSGIVLLNEASYTYPANSGDSVRSFTAEKAFLTTPTNGTSPTDEGLQIIRPDGRTETVKAPYGYLSGWPRVVNECLNRIAKGEPPPATARDGARAASLVFDAYKMAGEV
jgi:predicted dehydrogenase